MNSDDYISGPWIGVQGPHGGRNLAQRENMIMVANPMLE